MALLSRLFRGDAKLETAAISGAAHIAPGAVGPHVGKIQQALAALDAATIDAGELQAMRYGASTAAAALAYKKKRDIVNRSYQTQADNIVGAMTIASLDAEMQAKENGRTPVPKDRYVPTGYENLPASFLTTLRRSYDEKTSDNLNLANAMGWPPARTAKDMSFKEVLDKLQGDGLLAVVRAIHDRCVKTPGLWEKIHTIRNAWTYSAGNGVSQGMVWTAKDPDGAMSLLRSAALFCEDLWPMNADHQSYNGQRCSRTTFREIVASGAEGLHVCVVTSAYRGLDNWGGPHDIHIDRHQIGCLKYHANPNITLQAPNGSCVYLGLVEHAKDAIPYFLRKFGIDVQLDMLVGGFGGLVRSAGGSVSGVEPRQVADLISKAFPLMPDAVASQAADWFLATMKSFDAKK